MGAPRPERIPFAEAIAEPKLLKARFDSLSLPQQTLLKIFYGLPLRPQTVDPETGLSELDYWSYFQEAGAYDPLGYPQGIPQSLPYLPREFREGWIVIGRRGSKTDAFAATIVAYEATCGGHEAYLRTAQTALCFQVAQDLKMARYSLNFIRGVLESSPLLRKMIKQVTADRIDLKSPLVITCVPPTVKSVRGYASPIAVLDEVGVWYQESDAANPDREIYRAISPGQIQFPDRKLIGISTPWNKAGLLYEFYSAGTQGLKLAQGGATDEYQDILVCHGTTAVLRNPLITRQFLQRERDRDPDAFARECLAEFQDSISGFLPVAIVERAVARGVTERPPEAPFAYVAAIDPAFKRDAFAFTIVHRDFDNRLVQDVVRRYVAPPGEVLNPRAILADLSTLCDAYGIRILHSDQYQLESLQELAQDSSLLIIGLPFTGKNKALLYSNVQQLLLQDRLSLLDHYETLKELKTLERSLSSGGTVQISAPPGLHDDLAAVLVLACHQAQFAVPRGGANAPEDREPTPYQRVQATLARRRMSIQNALE